MADGKQRRKVRELTEGEKLMEIAAMKIFQDGTDAAQMDLLHGLDEHFFDVSYELVQRLVPINNFVAGQMKRFVDIVARLHSRYADQVHTDKEMRTRVEEADRKLNLALQTTGTTDEMLLKMKEALAEAWRMADAAAAREQLNLLKSASGHQDTQSKAQMSAGAGEADQKDVQLRELVFRERDRLSRELQDHQHRLEINRHYSEAMEAIVDDHRHTISKQQNSIKLLERAKFELEHNFRLVGETYEDESNRLKKQIESLKHANDSLRVFEEKYTQCHKTIENLRQEISKITHDNVTLKKLNSQCEEAAHRGKIILENLQIEADVLRRENNEKAATARANLQDMKKKDEMHAQLNRRFLQLDKKNSQLAEQEMLQKNDLTLMEKKLAIALSQVRETLQLKDESERQRTKQRDEITKLNDKLESIRYDLQLQRQRTVELQADLSGMKMMMAEKERELHKVNKYNNDLQSENNLLINSVAQLEEKKTELIGNVNDLQRTLQQKQKDLFNIKQQFETMHMEKTVLQKNFATCSQDRQTLQQLNSKHSFQIGQLVAQVSQQQKELNALKNQIEQLNSLVKQKQSEIHAKEEQLKSVNVELQETRIRSGQLQHTVEDDEKRFLQLTCSLKEERKQKNLVGLQMTRRNDELRLQREQLSMMQLAINHGTVQYNERIHDIRLLKTEIRNLRMSKDCLERSVVGTADMRHEIIRLERQLIREQLQVSAFIEEMKHPYRVHRWRVLRAKDPHRYELIGKIQVLLKRNLSLSMERHNMEQELQKQQLLYETLKKQVMSLADPQLKSRYCQLQRQYQAQNKKMRALKAELAINAIDLETCQITEEQKPSTNC